MTQQKCLEGGYHEKSYWASCDDCGSPIGNMIYKNTFTGKLEQGHKPMIFTIRAGNK